MPGVIALSTSSIFVMPFDRASVAEDDRAGTLETPDMMTTPLVRASVSRLAMPSEKAASSDRSR